jgi:arylsulfatase A-like enzyme
VGLSTLMFGFRNTGGSAALADDRNVLLITVDGWNHDTVRGPVLSAWIAEGAWFSEAVTPAPAVRAANATALTGLHPLRHKVLFDDTPLDAGYTSLAELLEREGYATGAFVSSPALNADSGLAQGFRVHDDDFAPFISGLYRLNLVKLLFAHRSGGRTADATVDRFESWFQAKSDLPFFAWVQLPAGDPEPSIARIDAALREAGVLDETLVMVAGTRGEARSHGATGENGLYDDVIRVPLAVRAPGVDRVVTEVGQQVRLMDLPGSAVTWLGLPPLDAEGVDLLDYVSGRRSATVWCALIGRTPDGSGVRIGLRNNGVKYLKDRSTGAEELYYVPTDPAEANDLKDRQPDTLANARLLLAGEEIRLDKLLGAP